MGRIGVGYGHGDGGESGREYFLAWTANVQPPLIKFRHDIEKC